MCLSCRIWYDEERIDRNSCLRLGLHVFSSSKSNFLYKKYFSRCISKCNQMIQKGRVPISVHTFHIRKRGLKMRVRHYVRKTFQTLRQSRSTRNPGIGGQLLHARTFSDHTNSIELRSLLHVLMGLEEIHIDGRCSLSNRTYSYLG